MFSGSLSTWKGSFGEDKLMLLGWRRIFFVPAQRWKEKFACAKGTKGVRSDATLPSAGGPLSRFPPPFVQRANTTRLTPRVLRHTAIDIATLDGPDSAVGDAGFWLSIAE